MRVRVELLGLALFSVGASLQAQAIAGTVRDGATALDGASVHAERTDRGLSRDAVTDGAGRFVLGGLTAGVYSVVVRRVGYRSAQLPNVRVPERQTVEVTVNLTQAPRQLSTIEVVTSPTSIDATTTSIDVRLDRRYTELLPSARDASSLIALVPGARKDQLWGGAPGVSNNYEIDGVAMNHPGLGGDFLGLSIDWIQTLEVRGLGAGAEQGNFQGGIINAVTKTGSNTPTYTIRTNYEAAGLTATNVNAEEEGVEQAGRREVSGEALGPIARDRLFYFVGAQYVDREMRSPNLTTAKNDFQDAREQHVDARAITKLTWLPALGQRVDALAGFSSANAERFGMNGVDDASALLRVRRPTTYYEVAWKNSSRTRHVFDARVAGFTSSATQTGYGGSDVPGVQLLRIGRMPSYQNAAFDETTDPSSVTGTLSWRTAQHVMGAEHALTLGTEATRGRWRDTRTRNGGLTWRPYATANLDPFTAATWGVVASDWGGEMHLDSKTRSAALFVDDDITLGARVTVSAGLRASRWVGSIRPNCGGVMFPDCGEFEAVRATGMDPRFGVVWDVTGRNTLAVRGHVGRYHQGLYSLFFDRVSGANVYSNSRFYYFASPLTDSRERFNTQQRNAAGSGFSPFFDEQVLDESGRVDGYRQPFVDQAVVGVEKTFGPGWKVELLYTNRRNGDIVGLVDRNLWRNYSPIYDVSVDHRFIRGLMLDAHGNRLVLPVIYVSNKDLYAALHSCGDTGTGPCAPIAGYTASSPLPYDQDLVLTTLPHARRRYDQVTGTLRSYHASWRGEASLTGARLRGNVAGVAGFGTSASRFTAGPFVRPNEAINFYGYLPDALQLEGKVWLSARLPFSLRGGVLYTHTLGERFTPSFQLLGRYLYTDHNGGLLRSEIFRSVLGQSIFVEPRGSRRLASRDVADAHLEWSGYRGVAVQFDLFNAFGANAITLINENIGDQDPRDPTSVFGAARLRVPPRALRVGVRLGTPS